MMRRVKTLSECFIVLFIILPNFASADFGYESLMVVEFMNTILILICSLFVLAILFILTNEKYHKILKSAHFLNMNIIVLSWKLIAIGFLLYALSEVGIAFGLIKNIKLYVLLKTAFAVLFAAGLFMRYQVVLKYITKLNRKE